MPSGVTCVTEEHFSFVKWTLAYLALGILGGGLAREKGRDGTGPGEAEGWCLRKWD